MGCFGSKHAVLHSSPVLPAGPGATSLPVPLQTLQSPPQLSAHFSTQLTTAPVTPSPFPGHNNGEPAHEAARHGGHVFTTQSVPAAPAGIQSPHHGGVPPSPQSNYARTLYQTSPRVGDLPMVLPAVPQLSTPPQRMHSRGYERGGGGSPRSHISRSMSVDTPLQHGPTARGHMARAASVSLVEHGHGQALRAEPVSTRSNQGRRGFPSIVKSILPDNFRYAVSRCSTS
jgi:hypothetical protein